MAAKIKLKRVGKVHAPQYRVIVADSRTKRDGRAIEEIGVYQPMQDPSLIAIDSERAQYWLKVGAQPTEAVLVLLKITGDWQKFKGLDGTEGTLKVKEPKADKLEIFNAALKEADGDAAAATTKKAKKAEPKAEEPAAEEPKAEEAAEAPAAEDAPAAEAGDEKTEA